MKRVVQRALHALRLCDHPQAWGGPTGTFYLSDKEGTRAFLTKQAHFDPERIEKLCDLLGKAMVYWSGDRVFIVMEDFVEESADFQVVRRGKEWNLVRFYSAGWERCFRQRVHRSSADPEDTSYWVEPFELLPGFFERFYEISEDEFRERATGVGFDSEGFPLPTPLDEDAQREMRRFKQMRFSRWERGE